MNKIERKGGKNFPAFSVAIPKIIPTFAVPNQSMLVIPVEHPDRCSIRNWAFFMSIVLLTL